MTNRHIGLRSLRTPNLYASYRIGDYPRAGLRVHPWHMTGTQAVLLNAFDLLANKRTKMFTDEVRRNEDSLHGYIEFDGPILLDSGAYNFLQHQELSIGPEAVLEIGLELRGDMMVVLDHPFPPKASLAEVAARLARTKANTRVMVEALRERAGQTNMNSVEIMPVLHGHDVETLRRSLNDIVDVLGHAPQNVGIGSLAPLAQNGSKPTVVDIIIEARRLLPDAYIHCFSMGSALLMLLAFYCGADTVDSQSWIMSAAFKQVQLPGFHLTRLSPREAERNPLRYQAIRRAFGNHLLSLIEEGFAIRDWDTDAEYAITQEREVLDYLSYLEDSAGVNNTHRRACHNLYAFNFEVARVRQELARGNLEDFIRKRVKNTVYRRVFDYAICQRTGVTGHENVTAMR